MSVWVYVDTSREVGDVDHVTIFATAEDADAWFKENDPEGVAFEYPVIGQRQAAAGTENVRSPGRPEVAAVRPIRRE